MTITATVSIPLTLAATCSSIQATTALAETTATADFRSLTVFSAIAVVICTDFFVQWELEREVMSVCGETAERPSSPTWRRVPNLLRSHEGQTGNECSTLPSGTKILPHSHENSQLRDLWISWSKNESEYNKSHFCKKNWLDFSYNFLARFVKKRITMTQVLCSKQFHWTQIKDNHF